MKSGSIRPGAIVLASFSLLVLVSLTPAVLAQADSPGGLTGSGTADDPYVITNVSGLQAIDDDLDAHYVLGDDIDASATSDWNAGKGFDPIGNGAGSGDGGGHFTGVFDGRNHTITGLSIRRLGLDWVGLFAQSGGVVRNVHVHDATVEGEYAGVLLGRNREGGRVSSVGASGQVTGVGQNTGGLAGINAGTLRGAWADVDVSSTELQTGGLVGQNNGEMTDVYATGAVAGESVGGLVGNNHGALQRGYAIGDVSGQGDDSTTAGGLVAGNNVLTEAYWNVETTGQSSGVGDGDAGGTGLRTAEMTGSAAADSMSALVSDDAWITTAGYPKLARNVEGLSAEFDGVVIAGNESELSASLTLVGDRTEGVVSVADYESSDTDVATVENGVVTGNQAGQATITVSHAGETATADVVVIAAEGISPTAAELERGNVTTGDAVTVTATLRNVDENATFRNVSLQVDGDNVTTANVTVDGDAETTHTFEWTPEEAGSYELTVDGIDAGTLQATDPAAEGSDGGSSGGSSAGDSGSTGGSTDGGSGDLPVTLSVGAILATAVVALLARRRR